MDCQEHHSKEKPILALLIVATLAIVGAALFMKYSNLGAEAVWHVSREGNWLLPLVGVSAVIDSINPCAFSVLLVTIAILFGIGRLRSNILRIGGAYIAGLAAVYLSIGLGIFQALHLFDTPHFMGKLAAIIMIAIGSLGLLGELFPRWALKFRLPHFAHHRMAALMNRASLPTAFALGGLVGLCEFPCTGGPYLMVLGLLHDTATYLKGVTYLLLYNLIFILPLVAILLIASNRTLIETVSQWQNRKRRVLRLLSGLAMLGLGWLILAF
ncbi:hypothetical protein HY628_02225 [Candidatus Uhrbacteria bacterium]|nr:hypothetical protein [Candidatus Uhrbacteria bacterium]